MYQYTVCDGLFANPIGVFGRLALICCDCKGRAYPGSAWFVACTSVLFVTVYLLILLVSLVG